MKITHMISVKKAIFIAAVTLGLVSSVAAVSPAHAALFSGAKQQACSGANLQNNMSAEQCEESSAEAGASASSTIQNVVNVLSIIVGIAAVIMIIINGLRFITANGDSGQINSARNGVIYAIVGLVIAAMAQIIVRFVLNRI